jgi:cobalt/nickel transport protein
MGKNPTMNMVARSALLLCCLLIPSSGRAHFHMLHPKNPSLASNRNTTILFMWGHPFEHEIFDASAPKDLYVVSPSGTSTAIKDLKPIKIAKARNAFSFEFGPAGEKVGDYTFVLNTQPIWMDGEDIFLQDTVKVVLHVDAEKGWDQVLELPFQLVPLTRPYGLEPGMVFQAQVLYQNKPVAGTLVEVERFNDKPPDPLPAEEFKTRTVKTDPNGILTCTLTDPGWWCVTASRDGGKMKHEGKEYPLQVRTTFWVFVDAKKK